MPRPSLFHTQPLLAALMATGLSLPLAAQAQVSPANVRALNTARETAVSLNGGLSVYRPAACMFETGTGGGSCLVREDSQGFLFRFNGGVPGWQQQGIAPTVETEIQVSADGRSVLTIVHNGSPR